MRSGGLFGKQIDEDYLTVSVWALRNDPYNQFINLLPEKDFFIELPTEGTVLSPKENFNNARRAAWLSQLENSTKSLDKKSRDKAANDRFKGFVYFLKIKKSVYERVKNEKQISYPLFPQAKITQTYRIQLKPNEYEFIGALNCTTNGYDEDVNNKHILSNVYCDQEEREYFSHMAAESVRKDDKYKNYVFPYYATNEKGEVQGLNTMIQLKDGTQLPVSEDRSGNTYYGITGSTIASGGMSEVTTTLYQQKYEDVYNPFTQYGEKPQALPSQRKPYQDIYDPNTQYGNGQKPQVPAASRKPYQDIYDPNTQYGKKSQALPSQRQPYQNFYDPNTQYEQKPQALPKHKNIDERFTEYGKTPEELYREGSKKEFAGDLQNAAIFYRRAADSGHINATASLANFYLHGKGGLEQDKGAAYRLTKKAAEAGHANAQFILGLMFEYGWDISADFLEAKRWYSKAANQENKDAKVRLNRVNTQPIVRREVFEAIYEALRDGQSGLVKSNFVKKNKHLSADEFIREVKRHAEDSDSRTAKAWGLTQKYNDFNPKNVELCSEIHAWSLEKSGLFKKSRAKSNLGASSLFGQDQQKEGSRTQKIVAALNRRYKP